MPLLPTLYSVQGELETRINSEWRTRSNTTLLLAIDPAASSRNAGRVPMDWPFPCPREMPIWMGTPPQWGYQPMLSPIDDGHSRIVRAVSLVSATSCRRDCRRRDAAATYESNARVPNDTCSSNGPQLDRLSPIYASLYYLGSIICFARSVLLPHFNRKPRGEYQRISLIPGPP
jgi:hypothetical protein